MRLLYPLVAACCLMTTNAHALSWTVNFVLADWLAAVGPSTLQDFSGYAGSSVNGVEVLPGVTLGTNLPNLDTRNNAEADVFATGAGVGSREAGNAYYEFDVGNAYQALAFEIGAYESALAPFNVAGGAVSSGNVEVQFADGNVVSFTVDPTDGTSNVFFGIRSDTAITRVRWIEGLEAGDLNEETTIDNLRVAQAVNQVPEPSSLLLAAGALALLARRRRG